MPRNKKYWEDRFGNPNRKTEHYYHQLDLRGIDDLDDEGFAYLIAGVKGVNMLDLNETEITNASIKLLTGLEYVKEIRAKSCYLLNDDCASDLDKITSLEFLHVRHTAITIDGLLKLTCLTNLKTLMFSANDVEAIKEKLLLLKAMLPQCDLVIDAKPYYFNAIELFIHAIKKQPYTYRVKIKNEPLEAVWSNWLIQPGANYIELENQGPYSIDDIEWIEINAVEKRSMGKLIAEKEIDHSEEIIKLLDYLSFPYMQPDHIISAYLVKREV